MKFSDEITGSASPAILEVFKDQLIIALAKRLADENGLIKIPTSEVDNTGHDVLICSANVPFGFKLELSKKS